MYKKVIILQENFNFAKIFNNLSKKMSQHVENPGKYLVDINDSIIHN